MDLTPATLAACYPIATREACLAWGPGFDAAAKEFGLADNPHVMACWLASMANESGQLSRLAEVSYFGTMAERIVYVFGTARTPPVELMLEWKRRGKQYFDEQFYNWLYDDRRPANPKLGNTQDGDGYRRRGLGPLQITGGNNQRAVSEATGTDFYANPDLLSDPVEGSRAAAAFYKINRIGAHAAAGTETGFLRAMHVTNPGLAADEFQVHHLVRWREVRLGLGIADDGRNAARRTQAELLIKGYDVGTRDGWIGPQTRAAMAAAKVAA
ncbi:MAG: hypothetical protein KF889_25350 [Alphaproteobacteria bacterium]|nr:hypothetical protein [Alphaproteobacteria bacterium]MCW5739680.1 hypothetical protein [Alphaproteobacteria bacterium]